VRFQAIARVKKPKKGVKLGLDASRVVLQLVKIMGALQSTVILQIYYENCK
jgi:hypothetical protein